LEQKRKAMIIIHGLLLKQKIELKDGKNYLVHQKLKDVKHILFMIMVVDHLKYMFVNNLLLFMLRQIINITINVSNYIINLKKYL